MLDIKQLCEDAHKNAVEKGFYDCPECGGHKGIFKPCNHSGCYSHISHPCEECGHVGGFCPVCKGTGIDPNKNIGELLALICSELYEALEAHRCGKFCDYKIPDSFSLNKTHFELHIKDTFEDEIADVFIRLFDLCGYLGIDLKIDKDRMEYKIRFENVGEYIYCISIKLPDLNTKNWNGKFDWFFTMLLQFCEYHKIDIEKHIALKMAYNKTIPKLHGKSY